MCEIYHSLFTRLQKKLPKLVGIGISEPSTKNLLSFRCELDVFLGRLPRRRIPSKLVWLDCSSVELRILEKKWGEI